MGLAFIFIFTNAKVAYGVNNAKIRCGEEYAPLWKETKAPNPGESGYGLPTALASVMLA